MFLHTSYMNSDYTPTQHKLFHSLITFFIKKIKVNFSHTLKRFSSYFLNVFDKRSCLYICGWPQTCNPCSVSKVLGVCVCASTPSLQCMTSYIMIHEFLLLCFIPYMTLSFHNRCPQGINILKFRKGKKKDVLKLFQANLKIVSEIF